MLWSKQYYGYDVERWLTEHGRDPLDARRDAQRRVVPHRRPRHHLDAGRLGVSLVRRLGSRIPAVALAMVDLEFAKGQLDLLLTRRYMHPNGQMPAYEWNFSDVNPPVHAWAAQLVYEMEKARTGSGRPRLAGERLSETGQELHLVAQPQGCRRTQRLPGRLPRAGQHRRVRPQRPAADRWPPGPGRRHRVDGAVLPEHAADIARSGRRTTRYTSSRRRRSSNTSHGSWWR